MTPLRYKYTRFANGMLGIFDNQTQRMELWNGDTLVSPKVTWTSEEETKTWE